VPTGTKASSKTSIPSLLPDCPISRKQIGALKRQKCAFPKYSFFYSEDSQLASSSPPSPAIPEKKHRREMKSNMLYYLLAGNGIPSDKLNSCSGRLWKSLHGLYRMTTGMRDSSAREFLSTAQPSYHAQTKYFYPVNLVNESLRVSSHLPLQLIRAQYPTSHVVSLKALTLKT